MRAWVTMAVAVMLSGAASSARAGAFDLYGFGGRSSAMGGAAVAAVDDHTGSFYNPAALLRRQEIHLGVGLLMARPHFEVQRARATELEVPGVHPDDSAGLAMGLVFPMGGVAHKRLAVGFGVYLPSAALLRVDTHDPSAPQLYMYQSLPDKLTLLAALAWRPSDSLSLGVGVQVLANIIGDVRYRLDVVNRRFVSRDTRVELVPAASPTAGLQWELSSQSRLALAWRGPLGLDYEIPADLELGETLQLKLLLEGTTLYTPHRFTLGGAFELADGAWLVAVDLSWSLWSQAPDPSPRVEVDLSGALVDGSGLGDKLDVGTRKLPLHPGFRDTWTPRLGVEHRVNDSLQVRAGYFYRVSPVPVAVGPSNYIDSNAHGFCVGVGLTFADPLEVHDRPITLELASQWLQHEPLEVQKRDPADPVGDYRMSGSVFSLQVGLRHDY